MFFPLHDQNNEAVKTVPMVSYTIIGLCLLVHLYTVILGIGETGQMKQIHFIYRHGLVPQAFFSGQSQYQIGAQNLGIETPAAKRLGKGEANELARLQSEILTVRSSAFWVWLMPLTCMFLHASWMHILTNMWFFWIFADNVEEKMGLPLFVGFYLIVGVFSSMAHALIQSASGVPMIGASGAVSGVMGAYLVLFPRNKITSYFCPIWFFIRRIDVPAIVVLGCYLLLNMLQLSQSGKFGANVAFDAHIFGFLGGLALGTLFRRSGRA
ncbi:MAG TPA: rhomboid family intramembrane serine protease [Candidatus Rifleibacterium sp.]|nr:rhomboid family intramembrane serine protease [Candidatus Rifleibacterium sp.]HPT46340.1 rhomboid family intramembrane serine protease [Candidatus Rifleibacterium sp.]